MPKVYKMQLFYQLYHIKYMFITKLKIKLKSVLHALALSILLTRYLNYKQLTKIKK